LSTFVYVLFFFIPLASAGELDTVNDTLAGLKTNYTWIESYKLNSWDCSTQSTTLWFILAEKGIKTKIAASVYRDMKSGIWRDHIFLIADLDGKITIIDATWLEIREPNPLKYGFYVTRFYNTPDEANFVWPGEYIIFNIQGFKRP